MADVADIVHGPVYSINLADVGKPEELPDIGAAMTQAFQRATNMVETSWFNQYQYQKAQYDLQDAHAKLEAQDTNNKLLQQTYQQRADLYPLQKQQTQLGLDQSQIGIDQQKYLLAQRDQANTDLAAFQKEWNGLDPNDPDYINKRNQIIAAHSLSQSNPATQAQFSNLVNTKESTYQNSIQQKVRNSYVEKLAPLLVPGNPGFGLIPTGTNLQTASINDLSQIYQQAQQRETTNRIRAALARAQNSNTADGNADAIKLGRMLNEVNAAPGGVSHFNADGSLDTTMGDALAGYEQKYGIVNPYAGAKKKVTITTGYDPVTGKPLNQMEIELPVTSSDVEAAQRATIPQAPKTYSYNYDLDPNYQQAKAALAGHERDADYKQKLMLDYQNRRRQAGLQPVPTQDETNEQYQHTTHPPTQNAVPAPGSTTTNTGSNVTTNPTPYTGRNPPKQQQQQNLIQPPNVTTPKVQQDRGYIGRRRTSYVFPDEQAPEGSWQRAWNDTVGQLASTEPQELSNEEIQQGIQEAEGRSRFASTETGVPEWYRFENPSPSQTTSGGGSYAPPKEATAVAGINPSVWGMVMKEEGPEFGPDSGHPSVFGLWGDKPGVESQAYKIVRQYGAHSPEAYQAVTSAWVNGFLRQSQPWLLNSPGMQGLVISDSQHQGGASAARIIEEMGGWQAVNQMDPKEAVAEYTRLRQGLWPGNLSRVRREENWALANS